MSSKSTGTRGEVGSAEPSIVPAQPPTRRTVLHFTESYGGGVATAIGQYITSAGDSEHKVIGRIRSGDISQKDYVPGKDLVASRMALVAAWRRARKQPIDVVHIHSSVAGVIARIWRHPTALTIYSPHGVAFSGRKGRMNRAVARFVESALAGRAQRIGAVGTHEGRQMQQVGVERSAITVVPHALTAGPARSYPDAEDPHFVIVGRISFQKDPALLIELVKRWRKEHGETGAKWIWVGDGDPVWRRRLESADVNVTGWLPRSNALKTMTQAMAVIHTARYEGFPMTVLESLSVGTPVVARAIPELVDAGSILRAESVDTFLIHLRSLLNQERWEAVSRRGQDEVREKFSEQNQRRALEALYGTVL